MKKYKSVEVSEKQLEDLMRQGADLIEDGLRYIDHQRMTDRGPLDILMVDSGNALIIAELKVVEDDTMLVQGMDYYDYVSRHTEGMARVYKDFGVDPKQDVRLLLIAPSFSVPLISRCKWIKIPLSLFMYKCIVFEDSKEVVPIFFEVRIPPEVERIDDTGTPDDRLEYITDLDVRNMANDLVKEIQGWDRERILAEPTKYDISLKVSGRVFSYIGPRRKHFMVYTHDSDKEWTGYAINKDADMETVKNLLRADIERLGKGAERA